ncbi:MAG TPA: GerMN domain-containing protein [Candidatus Paceibacterota bacterium]
MNTKTIVLTLLALGLIGFIVATTMKKEPAPATTAVVETSETPIENVQKEDLAVKVYFANSIKNPGFMDCRVVHPITRTVPYTLAVAEASLNELIKGLTGEDIANGFQTSIDPNTKIKSLAIVNGVATVDFSKELNNKNVGLCAGQFIEAQITQTLMQFPSVQKVNITVEGKGDIVQP